MQAAATVALALAAAPAGAVDEEAFLIDTSADLARLCGAAPGSERYAEAVQMCQGYILGVHHFHTALAAELDNDIYCFNRDAEPLTRNQIMQAFSTWVAENPGVGETEAINGLLQWAAQTFPCS